MDAEQREREIADVICVGSIGELSLEGLLLATRNGEPVGVCLTMLQPDGCGFVWPPVVASKSNPEDVADALLQDVARRLDDAGAWIGQCLLDADQTVDAKLLTRNGFQRLTELVYLQRSLKEPLPDRSVGRRVDVVRVDSHAGERRLGELIERTYDASQDCQGLDGLRSGREAVHGHRATGVLLPEQWMIFREVGEDAGVLILADQPGQNAWELVYMGVVPEARGRRYGEDIVHVALQEARRSEREWLVLAVDAKNDAARRVYDVFGFAQFDSKVVFVRPPGSGQKPGF